MTVAFFRLYNREFSKEIEVIFYGEKVKYYKVPVYLGITLDRTLTYKAQEPTYESSQFN